MTDVNHSDLVSKLSLFGAWCLNKLAEGENVYDIDAADAYEFAVKLGVINKVTVTEPCGENCLCAEIDDFPTECGRYSEGVTEFFKAVEEYGKNQNARSS